MGIQDEIFEWVQGFELWKQDLFRRASATTELSEEDVRDVVALLLDEVPGSGGPQEVTREDLPGASGAADPMSIEALASLVNVNALADGQTLQFEPVGLNIVFGKNGAGKTGYSRVMKHAGRTLYRETILTNQAQATGQGPSAGIRFAIGSESHEFTLDLGATAPAILGRICIFDSLAGEEYLTSQTEVDYAPTTLNSLRRLILGLRKVEAELQRRLGEATPAEIDLETYPRGTRVAGFLAELSASVSDQAIVGLSTLSDDEEAEKKKLQQKRAEIEAMQAPRLRRDAEQEAVAADGLGEALTTLGRKLDGASVEGFRERQEAVAAAQRASGLAARAFAGEPVPGAGGEPWRYLWEAAQDFVSHQGRELPDRHDPAHCPLCMQELSAEARDRFVRFDEFVKADVIKRLRTAENHLTQARAALPDPEALRDRHAETLTRLGLDPGQPGRLTSDWLETAGVIAKRLREGDLEGLTGLQAPPVEDVQAWVAKKNAEAAEHAALENVDDQEKLRRDLDELEARHRLGERRASVLDHVARLRKCAQIEAALQKTPIGPVSAKITKLSKSFVEADLQGLLNAQLEALDFQGLTVKAKPKTVEGKSMVGLNLETVDRVSMTDVLSQGEQRRLSLAMFLAEMEALSDASPIVFDDPSSSIDQEGRRHIARTLAGLAETRQVIVFTHELSFVHELRKKAADDLPIHVQHVRRRGRTAGYVHPDLPWEGLKAAQRPGPLHEKLKILKELKESDDDRYRSAVTDFCQMMRAAFERTVEERVLADVVTRRDDTVHTTALSKVALTDDICDLVKRGTDESSPWLHDQPLTDGADPPTPAELREGLDILEELLAAVKAVNRDRKSGRQEKAALASVDAQVADGSSGEQDRKLKAVPALSEQDASQEASPNSV